MEKFVFNEGLEGNPSVGEAMGVSEDRMQSLQEAFNQSREEQSKADGKGHIIEFIKPIYDACESEGERLFMTYMVGHFVGTMQNLQ